MAERFSLPEDAKFAKTVSDLVGGTPLLLLNKVTEGAGATVLVKLEMLNPSMSVKDRIGKSIVEDAEKQGLITPGKTVLVEMTSGNTGISLAMQAAARGYRLIIVMPHTVSSERKVLILAFGAEVVLVDSALGLMGVKEKTLEIVASTENSFYVNQFESPVNVQTHFETTGPEIWRDTAGAVDILVAGVGTSGTLAGTSAFLKSKNPNVYVAAVEPEESPVLSGGEKGKHNIQGIGAGIIPPLYDKGVVDEVVTVHSHEAFAMAKDVTRKEGLLVGISSGAAICAALKLAKRPENAGKVIVTMLASAGERYMSTDLYQAEKKIAEELPVWKGDGSS